MTDFRAGQGVLEMRTVQRWPQVRLENMARRKVGWTPHQNWGRRTGLGGGARCVQQCIRTAPPSVRALEMHQGGQERRLRLPSDHEKVSAFSRERFAIACVDFHSRSSSKDPFQPESKLPEKSSSLATPSPSDDSGNPEVGGTQLVETGPS